MSGAAMAYERPFPHASGARPPAIPTEVLPRHVAVVMDGNGRWANERGLPRTKGHEAGEASLLDVVAGAIEIGVTHLSAYAFSTENWKRSPEEVRFLMGFNRDVIRRRRDQLVAVLPARPAEAPVAEGRAQPLSAGQQLHERVGQRRELLADRVQRRELAVDERVQRLLHALAQVVAVQRSRVGGLPHDG